MIKQLSIKEIKKWLDYLIDDDSDEVLFRSYGFIPDCGISIEYNDFETLSLFSKYFISVKVIMELIDICDNDFIDEAFTTHHLIILGIERNVKYLEKLFVTMIKEDNDISKYHEVIFDVGKEREIFEYMTEYDGEWWWATYDFEEPGDPTYFYIYFKNLEDAVEFKLRI